MFAGSTPAVDLNPATSTGFYATYGPSGTDSIPVMEVDGSGHPTGLFDINTAGYYEISGAAYLSTSVANRKTTIQIGHNDAGNINSGVTVAFEVEVELDTYNSPMAYVSFSIIDYIPDNRKVFMTVKNTETNFTLTPAAGTHMTIKYIGND